MGFDVLFRRATLHDGADAAGRQLDVAVKDGRIVALGDETVDELSARTIDAGGLALAPGFVDLHTRFDLTLPAFPEAPNSVTQGATTEVVGNCGFSPAPVGLDQARAEELRAFVGGLGPDLDWSWRSFGSFLDRLEAVRPAVNLVPLVGYGALRIAAMGMDDRPPTYYLDTLILIACHTER